jgi:hypothetical protein
MTAIRRLYCASFLRRRTQRLNADKLLRNLAESTFRAGLGKGGKWLIVRLGLWVLASGGSVPVIPIEENRYHDHHNGKPLNFRMKNPSGSVSPGLARGVRGQGVVADRFNSRLCSGP